MVSLLIGALFIARQPKLYRSSALIWVQPQNFPEQMIRDYRVDDGLRALAEVIYSRTLLQQIMNEEKLYENRLDAQSPDELISLMRRNIHVEVKGNDVFSLSFDGESPTSAMNVTNRLARRFVALLREQVGTFPSQINPRILVLEQNLKDQNGKLLDLQTQYTVDHPEVILLKKKIAELEASLTREKEIARSMVPGPEVERKNLEARVMDWANLPDAPDQPKMARLISLCVVASLVIGFAVGLTLEYMDRSFCSAGDLQQFFGMPVLACIPEVATRAQERWRTLRRSVGWVAVLLLIGATFIYLAQNSPTRPRGKLAVNRTADTEAP